MSNTHLVLDQIMANPESENRVHEVISELERLVKVWKNLGHSYMNFESIADLITQKLVGLGALGDNDIHDSSLKNLGRSVGIRNTMVELNVCSTRNYGEHWGFLDAFLKKMITVLSDRNPMDATSDLRCLETLEEWAAIGFQMMKYAMFSPESCNLLDHVVVMRLNTLWKTFEKGLVVKDDVNSMRVLELAAKLRDTLRPQFHIWIDKIVAQKLRILSIRQAGKSDVHQESIKQETGFGNDNLEAAVSNVELNNLGLNQKDLSTVAWIHDHQGSSHHPRPGLTPPSSNSSVQFTNIASDAYKAAYPTF
ncbi:MAG: hypothetical protein Q9175_006080 [Cornicularia normoerica]